MANDLTTITPKLSKFLRLLSSDKPNEIIAAVRALQRTLKAAGSDIHALANIVQGGGGGLTEAEMSKLYEAGRATGIQEGFQQGLEAAKRDTRANGFFRNVDTSGNELDWNELALFCWDRLGCLHPRHHGFIEHMVDFTEHGTLTERQQNYLRSLYRQVGGRLKPKNV